VLSEEELEGVQLLRHSLDVVETIHPDDHLDAVEPLLELLDSLLDGWSFQTLRTQANSSVSVLDSLLSPFQTRERTHLRELSRLNTDGEGSDVGVVTLKLHSVGHSGQAENSGTR
jgi:hypothetical protein